MFFARVQLVSLVVIGEYLARIYEEVKGRFDRMIASGSIILCSDDFAMTRGVSEAILSLAEKGRLSATSAIVTTVHWPTYAKSVMLRRDRIALGLHLNLTFGHPLGPMRELAPNGVLPHWHKLIRRTVTGRINRPEIAAEIGRQLDRFEAEAGFPPDFIDGHHHIHILPVIRHVVIEVLSRRFPARDILLRDPSDNPMCIIRRRIAAGKALSIGGLAIGFRQLATARGFSVNTGFSGYSTFGAIPTSESSRRFCAIQAHTTSSCAIRAS
jgi:predicted glycoside hydrolase/deacetylase ChbG (UPF0249 family)